MRTTIKIEPADEGESDGEDESEDGGEDGGQVEFELTHDLGERDAIAFT